MPIVAFSLLHRSSSPCDPASQQGFERFGQLGFDVDVLEDSEVGPVLPGIKSAVFSGHDHVYERVKPENGIYYFTEGSSGQLRPNDLAKTSITDRGFDTDRTFMLVEVAGDVLYFETLSRGGAVVDSGELRRPVRTP